MGGKSKSKSKSKPESKSKSKSKSKKAKKPPKTRSPSPGKKRGKKFDKEEEERLAQEEEVARLVAEKEEEEKQEREKREAEAIRLLENEEKKRRRAQLEELSAIISGNKENLKLLNDERRKIAKWDRYMRCDGSPDPTIPGEINTYLNLWKEDKERVRIEDVLNDSKLALQLIGELEFILEDTPTEDLPVYTISQYKSTITDLQAIVHEKLFLANYNVLVDASKLADPETYNLQSTFSNPEIELNVWGNLSKNPRTKSFEFDRVTFDIPRLLRMTDCGIAFLFTTFDHISGKCYTYTAHLKEKPEEVIEEVPVPEEDTEKEKEKEEGEQEKEPKVEETEDVMAALNNLNAADDENKVEEEEVEEEVPEEILEEDLVKTPEPLDFEDFDGVEEIVDLRAYSALGGVFHFKLVHLPPQPKTMDDLVMVQVQHPPEMEDMEYQADVINPDKEKDKEQEGETEERKDSRAEKEKADKEKKDEKPAITISLKLPSYVSVVDEPVVGRWVEKHQHWTTDGFIDANFNEETRSMTFTTPYFGTFALFQDTYINMPFQSWDIRPRAIDHVLFTIIAAISEITIEIKGGLCCLQVGEAAELVHLKDAWMTAPALIKAMKNVGINLFPDPDSTKYVSVQDKNVIAENRLYMQMALTASSIAYTWSRWNSACENQQQIVIQAAETLQDIAVREEDWSLYLVTRKRITNLKMSEFDEAFTDDYAEGTNFHADMYHMVMDTVSTEAQERIHNSSAPFVNCVHQLLQATKPVTYS